jgi:hypothetical protein
LFYVCIRVCSSSDSMGCQFHAITHAHVSCAHLRKVFVPVACSAYIVTRTYSYTHMPQISKQKLNSYLYIHRVSRAQMRKVLVPVAVVYVIGVNVAAAMVMAHDKEQVCDYVHVLYVCYVCMCVSSVLVPVAVVYVIGVNVAAAVVMAHDKEQVCDYVHVCVLYM